MGRVWVAAEDEAGAVAELMCAFRDWWGYAEPDDEAMLAGVARLLGAGESEFLLGAADGDPTPAGVVQLRYRHGVWLGALDCWLEDLYVRDAARRSGLGGALLDAALVRARERGCRRIELDVNEANPAALALYESRGFSARSDPPGGRNLLMRRRLG